MSDTALTSAGGISARGVTRHFEAGRVRAVDGLDLDIAAGEFVAICGPSGCGKSTLLHLMAGVDRPDSGELSVGGQKLSDLTVRQADAFRRSVVGLVFQLHNLLPELTALENVQVPMLPTQRPRGLRRERAEMLLDRVGLSHRGHALPTELSVGERQRVAVARALANEPGILLADEPTGALDSANSERLLDLLDELHREVRTTLVVVTHDPQVADRAQRILHMLDGRIVDQRGGADNG